MDFVTYKIESSSAYDMKTEIIYTVKGAFVAGERLIVLNFVAEEPWSVLEPRAAKILRALKREKAIELFVDASELKDAAPVEAVYLLNKFPKLPESVDIGGKNIIVKI